MGSACKLLNGVTGKSRTLGPKDVGHTLSLAVRATDSNGTTTAYASLLGPVEAAGPSPFSTTQPALSGSGETGSTLTVGPGGWHPRPGSLSYQWVRCDGKGRSCAPIGGATGATHEVSPDDLGHTLVAIVAARSGATSQAVFSAGSLRIGAPLPVPVPKPVTTPPPPKATTTPVVPPPAATTTTTPAATTTTPAATTTTTPAVTTPPPKPTTTAPAPPKAATTTAPAPAPAPAPAGGPTPSSPPAIAQVVQQGRQLVGSVGSWAGSGAIAYGTQWYRCDASGAHCKSIRGATKSTYTLVAADVGQTLGFAVRASDAGGTTAAYASLMGPVAAASAGLVSTGQPLVTGTASVGGTVQVSSGGWTQAPASFGYQWVRCNANGRLCVPIAGATGASYVVTAADAGHALAALVLTGTDAAASAALSTAAGVP
jgi:hypothetical protein